MKEQSQRNALLKLLCKKEVVTLPEIMNLKTGVFPFRHRIANYTALISELRKLGYIIKNTKKWSKGKRCMESFYTLVK